MAAIPNAQSVVSQVAIGHRSEKVVHMRGESPACGHGRGMQEIWQDHKSNESPGGQGRDIANEHCRIDCGLQAAVTVFSYSQQEKRHSSANF